MTVTHTTAARNGMADYIVDQLDLGFLKYMTSADAEIASGAFAAPAFGPAAAGIATANAIGDALHSGATLVVAKFSMQTSTPTDVVFGSVTAVGGGGDIEISGTSIADGESIVTNSLTYAAAP